MDAAADYDGSGGGHRGGVAEKPRLMLRRSAGVGLSLFQMTQDFSNDLLLGDEGDDAEGASTLTFQRVGLIDPLDELRPAFSEGGIVRIIAAPRASSGRLG